jgi:hypothetical protein
VVVPLPKVGSFHGRDESFVEQLGEGCLERCLLSGPVKKVLGVQVEE